MSNQHSEFFYRGTDGSAQDVDLHEPILNEGDAAAAARAAYPFYRDVLKFTDEEIAAVYGPEALPTVNKAALDGVEDRLLVLRDRVDTIKNAKKP